MSGTAEEPAIRVRGVGKRYRVGTGRKGSGLMDRMGRLVGGTDRNPFGDTTLWALRDISFDLARGQVLGLVGRNGSGKTTLVRILARITAPSEGSAMVNGRVGALFQMGAGFHPELTGRENISLSGAVLGMSEEKVAAAFDSIVDFAELGDFLESPIKHYSSGMLARLGFSVSAHLDAEIMLIDEGLAVGDARFVEKCRSRIRDMVVTGRTVVYVSHALDTVRDICDNAIVLDKGEMAFSGEAGEAVAYYQELNRRARVAEEEAQREPPALEPAADVAEAKKPS